MASFGLNTLFLLIVFVVIFVGSQASTFNSKEAKKHLKKTQKKGFQVKPQKHKDTQEFVKKLEYEAGLKEGDNALDFGLAPIDLNLLQDEEFAEDVVEGVEEELAVIDQEFGEPEDSAIPNENDTSNKGTISLMHQGMYTPSPEYNNLIDGLVSNAKKDLQKREMDPLYFGIHKKGIVRHNMKTKTPVQNQFNDSPSEQDNTMVANGTSGMPLGVGIIVGLRKLKRFGNAESRDDGNVTLVRSHYFFGPLSIDLIFGSVRGIHIINTTLSSLAAHTLIEVSNVNDSRVLKEFIMDSPMEYEIRLRGAKNRRFRSLSQESISRLFKRGGRMETRLERSFSRGLRKPIRDVASKKKNKAKRIDDNNNKDRGKKDRNVNMRKP